MKLKCVIVDDEPLAITVLQGYLKKIPTIEVIATFNDALSVYEILKEQEIDFLFLDIEMPNLTGIDFLKSFTKPPLVIITSANKNYAIEGFELNVIDYILKPLTFERLLKAINKIIEIKSAKPIHEKDVEITDHIYLKENKRMVKIYIENILYIESIKDYVKVVTKSKTVITKQQLGYFETILNPKKFIKIHRSYIIAVNQIDAFSCSTVEIGSIEIPIGRKYKEETLQKLGEIESIES